MATMATMREAVGLFHHADALRSAADALMLNGFDRADLSILASESAVDEKLHRAYTAAGLEDDPQVPTVAYFSGDSLTELKAAIIGGSFFVGAVSAGAATIANDGTLNNAIINAVVAGGLAGVLGTVVAWWLTRHHNNYLNAQLRHGGLLLWVHTIDLAHEERACRILEKNTAADVHVHDVPKREWERTTGRGKVVYGFLEFLAGVKPPAKGEVRIGRC